jgi:predicted enzyme related to lactoylglutathione lyase
MRGRFVWEDLMTTDVASAAAFYNKVAGLKTAPAPFDPSFTTFLASDRGMGGLMPMAAEAKAMGAPPSWLSYVGVDNVDDIARQAASLGGKVLKPAADIPNVGRFAILQDPQGAVFAVFSTTLAVPAPATVPLGHMSWHELATSDYVGAFSFYQSLFGWHVTGDMDMGAMGTYRLFAPEGSKDAFGGMYTKPAQQPGPPAWLPYIKVADAKGATAKAKSLGAQILHGPADVPGGGLITMAIDPQGAAFALHQTAAAQSRAAASPKPKARASKKKRAGASPKRKAKTSAKAAKKSKRKAGSKK